MKLQKHLTGVALIAFIVAASLLAAGSWFASLAAPANQEVSIEALPSDGNFDINLPIAGKVALSYGASGALTANLQAPTAQEQTGLPDLGELDISLLLHKGSGPNVSGYVDLETTLVFTGYHTIKTSVTGTETTLTVGPKVSGTYQNGVLNLLSERVRYTTDSGQSLERQFRLAGVSSQSPGILTGEYRETIFGYSVEPFTVVGTFQLKDLKITMPNHDTNEKPTANPLALKTQPNKAVAANLTGSDPEGGALTFILVTQPLNGTLSGTAPKLTYTPKKDFKGADSFTFKVNDGGDDSATVAVTLDVSDAPPVNHAPTANGQTVSVVTEQLRNITLTGSDADGNALTFSVVSQPSHGSLSGTPPALKYKSGAGYTGKDSFTFKVNDGKLDSAIATVNINVKAPNATNTEPTANGQALTTAQGAAIAITLNGDDADGDSVTFIIVTDPEHGALNGTAPDLTYTPESGFVGTDSFTYKVHDGELDSPIVTVTIVVTEGTPTETGGKLFLPVSIRPDDSAIVAAAPTLTPTVAPAVASDGETPVDEGMTIYLPITNK